MSEIEKLKAKLKKLEALKKDSALERSNDPDAEFLSTEGAVEGSTEGKSALVKGIEGGEKTPPKTDGMTSKELAGVATAAGIAGSAISKGSPTSSSAGVIGGALSGAAVGASIGTAFGGPGIGTAVGATAGAAMGHMKAKEARKAKLAQIESDHHMAISKIAGEKGKNVQVALQGMRSAFSSALLQKKKVQLV